MVRPDNGLRNRLLVRQARRFLAYPNRSGGLTYPLALRACKCRAHRGIVVDQLGGKLRLSGLESSCILLVLGASVGYVPSYLSERRKERHALVTRWDESLYKLCVEFASVARNLRHLAEWPEHQAQADGYHAKLDHTHAQLRALGEQIRLLGSEELQRSARMVIRHGYAMRLVAEGKQDPRHEEFGGRSPSDRLISEMHTFYREARRVLGVADHGVIAEVD